MSARPLDISVREALKVAEDEGGGFVYVHGDDGKPAAIVLTMIRAEAEIPDVTEKDGPERWAHTHIDLETDHPDVTGDHVLEVREDGWSLEHPLRCRTGQVLLDCPVHKAATRSLIKGGVPGRYKVRVANDAATMLAFVETLS